MSHKKREGAKIGRPPKKPEDRAERRIRVRVTVDQERRIQELASKQNLTISEMFRAYLLAAEVAAANPGSVGPVVLGDAGMERELDQRQLEERGQQKLFPV